MRVRQKKRGCDWPAGVENNKTIFCYEKLNENSERYQNEPAVHIFVSGCEVAAL